MASTVLGVKQFVVHYGGSWGTTRKIKGSDYKGGKRSSTMKFDGDEFSPTTSKPTRAPIIPTTASDNSLPPMKSPIKAQQVKAQPVKAHLVKSTPIKAHPLPTTPKKKSVQVSASVRKSPRFTPTTPIPPPSPIPPPPSPNGETLMLDLVSSSDDDVEEIVEVEHVVEVAEPEVVEHEVAEPEVAYTINDVVDDWEHVLGSLDPETFDEVTLGETFIDGDGDALDDKDRSDDEGDKMYEYGYSFGLVFGTVTNNDEWSAKDEDEEDYNYNPSDSDYSVCGTDDEALDDMEPMEEEVQNLEEEIQGSDSSVVRPKMSWPTVEACRDFFINLAIRKKFNYRHLKNDKERLILEYKDFNCQWKVSASVTKRDNHTFILRKFLDQHTCEADDENKYAHATSPWVAKTLVDKMRDHPDYNPRDIQKEIFCEFGVSISYWIAWSSRVLMLGKINGNYEVGYQVVPEMCRQIEKSNPSSLVKWFVKDSNQTFIGVVIAFKGSLDGWVTGCRLVIGLDGCFLKGKYGGCCLTAIGLDAMNGLFHIGFYVCKGENKDTWRLFLSELKPHLIKHKEKLTFISDRQKGLVPTVAEYFPDSNHRYCSPYFSVEAFKATYASYLYPLDNMEDWPEITLDKEVVLPPKVST
ncbi:hypothetical protein IFM89_027464 [Coptis chinensis]|uniref:Transposase MuDR plant domain-containing protein n=1 Tax=Coptis chinensis TaxID=261450 RepID=A0A835HQJ6_9MAGN|nr:hypothetical protein IFM89_027464 [Coptis chinensis]